MWHFVVCDDEELFRYEIVSRLRKALEGLGVDRKDYEILEYASLAQLHTCPVSPDWLLLDVLFQGESDGTQVAIHLRRKWPNMQLLFISSAAAFVWNSFEA